MNIEPEEKVVFYKTNAFKYLLIACLALVACAIGAIFYNQHPKPLRENRFAKRDIHPGSNRATLTLSNGRKVILDGAPDGILAEESGSSIMITGSGQITYAVNEKGRNVDSIKSAGFNTLQTPLGGQYQVRLPDGTKVWLNAASKLTYPTTFVPHQARKVELTGEAYFEVPKVSVKPGTNDSNAVIVPFIVVCEKQRVEVQEARFNVNSYADEGSVKTSMLEGLAKINYYTILKQGNQSVINEKGLEIRPVDAKAAVAWKNALFLFNDESLENIMKNISRWYNVEVFYKDPSLKKELFSISVSRLDNVSATLKALENTGLVRFKIKGEKITVDK